MFLMRECLDQEHIMEAQFSEQDYVSTSFYEKCLKQSFHERTKAC